MNFWILFLHVFGACIWVGGHLYLVICVMPKSIKNKDSQLLLNFEATFERLGMGALALQIATGLYMASVLLPSWGLLFDYSTSNPFRAVSILICLKLLWLTLTAITALSAQLWVIPKVKNDTQNYHYRKVFVGHIVLITLLSLAFLVTGLLFRIGI